MVTMFCAAASQAQDIPQPEAVRNQEATYNEVDNTVTLTATAPSFTEYDWDYSFTNYPLDHISHISIYRHEPSTSWPETPLAQIDSPEVGSEISYVDHDVEADMKYEYKFVVDVDGKESYGAFVSIYTGVTPGALKNFSATVLSSAATSTDLSATAPDTTISGAKLTKPVSIVFQIKDGFSYVTLYTAENVQPGETVTWQHQDIAPDTYCHYAAYALVGTAGKGQSADADVFVGLDRPGTPLNFTGDGDGDKVRFNWEAPATGDRYGQYDEVTYTLRMKYNDGEEETIAENIEGTSYEYTVLGEEATMTFSLTAANSAGECLTPATTEQVTAGQLCALPFLESFTNAALTHKGWQKATTQYDEYYTYDAWYFAGEGKMYYLPLDDYVEVTPQDIDGGFAACKFYGFSEDWQTESLISPRINLKEGTDKKVAISFYYWNAIEEACKNEVQLQVSKDDGEWETVIKTEPLKTDDMPQWEEYSEDILVEGASYLRIKIDAIRHDGPICNVYIDNVSVKGIVETDINTAVIEKTNTDNTEYFTTSGIRTNRPTTPGTYIVRTGKNVKKVVVK